MSVRIHKELDVPRIVGKQERLHRCSCTRSVSIHPARAARNAQCHSRDPQPIDLLPVLGVEDLDPVVMERSEWKDS